MADILIASLSSVVLATIVNQIFETFRQRRQRAYQLQDVHSEDLKALKRGLMFLLLDKIKFLGLKEIEHGEITYENRKILNDAHDVYHTGLGGNGDLDLIMKDVNNLPLKK